MLKQRRTGNKLATERMPHCRMKTPSTRNQYATYDEYDIPESTPMWVNKRTKGREAKDRKYKYNSRLYLHNLFHNSGHWYLGKR